MNAHVGAKPFQCPKCLKCFGHRGKMTQHTKFCESPPIPFTEVPLLVFNDDGSTERLNILPSPGVHDVQITD